MQVQGNNEGFCGLCGLVQHLYPEGPGKDDYSDISKVCYFRCQKTVDGSLKVKIDLSQRSYRCRM